MVVFPGRPLYQSSGIIFRTKLKSLSHSPPPFTWPIELIPFLFDVDGAEGYYAINNQFQTSGPKGFTEIKILDNGNIFVRMDLPGAGQDEDFNVSLHPSRKSVKIKAYAPRLHIKDFPSRRYVTTTKVIFCDCCKILSFIPHISDGVLRLNIFKAPINIPQHSPAIPFLGAGPSSPEDIPGPCTQRSLHSSDPYDPELTGRRLQTHPYVTSGPLTAYESKELQDGSLFVRLDMPGVPKENFNVFIENGTVRVTGQAPAIEYDSGGRFYSAEAALLTVPFGPFPCPTLMAIAHNGVIRLHIGPR